MKFATPSKFKFSPYLEREYQFGLDPNRPICRMFLQFDGCPRGNSCPDKHMAPTFLNKIVCKHWLRGLCKKGLNCEFLHEYNLQKMPECQFYVKNGFCTQSPDCQYLHIDPASKIPVCFNYEKGFCKMGPECSRKHIRRMPCPLYITGFCPKGRMCEFAHPKFVGIYDYMIIKDTRKKVEGKEAKGGKDGKGVSGEPAGGLSGAVPA